MPILPSRRMDGAEATCLVGTRSLSSVQGEYGVGSGEAASAGDNLPLCADAKPGGFLRHRIEPKTACSARGGVLYTQLAKFAALAVQGGVEPQTENCERRTAKTFNTGRYRSGQTGQTVNLLAYAFAGSNPALPILRRS